LRAVAAALVLQSVTPVEVVQTVGLELDLEDLSHEYK